MKKIENIETHLSTKRRTLFLELCENNWKVVEINADNSDWCYDEKWIVESTRESKGFKIQLWFFKYEGLYDGVDRVECTKIDSEKPNPYGGDADFSIWFDGRNFEKQLKLFLENIHKLRCMNNNT